MESFIAFATALAFGVLFGMFIIYVKQGHHKLDTFWTKIMK